MTDRGAAAARRSARRAVRARRAQLTARGVAVDDAYRTMLAEARGGAFGATGSDLGWFHEDFHSDDKDAVFAAVRGGVKIDAAGVVAASRVYTPPHVVAFLLQNTLGAWWLARAPSRAMGARWPFLVAGAVGPAAAYRPLRELRLLDPCCGAGAFLLAAFDMLVDLYAEERRLIRAGVLRGVDAPAPADVAATIVACNLVGADVDPGAVALLREELAARGGGGPDRLLVLPGPVGSLDRAVWGDERFDVVCTNPPYVGFRQLDPVVKAEVTDRDPGAHGDLALAFQRRCWELLADAGRCGTVTPAGWMNGRDGLGLRDDVLAHGGPCIGVALGQRVFAAAPLVFAALSVVSRGPAPRRLAVLRPAGGGAHGLAAAVASPGQVELGIVRELPTRPFLPAAPDEVLRLGRPGRPRVGDRFTTADGVWTGSNARDVRYWWEVAGTPGWVRLSGGQGHQPWAAPIRLRIREEVAGAGRVRDGGVEYPRVAGGRLGARVAEPGTAALAGVVTFVPRDADAAAREPELLALFNSRVGGAWLATLTSGLNFNPGYAAMLPLGEGPAVPELHDVVRRLVALRRRLIAADPTADAFVAVLGPHERARVVAEIAGASAEADRLLAAHLGLSDAVVAALPAQPPPRPEPDPRQDAMMVAVLRAAGMRWPGDGGPATEPRAVTWAAAEAAAAAACAKCDGDPGAWVRERCTTVVARRFHRRLALTADRTGLRLAPGRA